MSVKQVTFYDHANEQLCGGILIQGGCVDYIICGCCGGVIEADDPDIDIIVVHEDWKDISENIFKE